MRAKTFLQSLILAIAASFNVLHAQAATTVDFETPALAPDSYYQGADSHGGFLNQGTFFSNYYTEITYQGYTYTLWENWALSNMTDTTTPDYFNQFSAITGSGQLGSSQYAIGFGTFSNNNIASLDFAEPRSLAGGYFTNTTYDYFTMATGNGFANKFTRARNDYFKLTITGVDPLGNATGSTYLYLADFRGPELRTDNARTDDYILDTWNWVDLSGLGNNVKTVRFSFDSSDVGDYGINTPFYFALDNLTFNGTVANPPVWTGAGGDGLFSNSDNWYDRILHNGEPLQLAGSVQATAVNDLTGASFAGIDWHYGTGSMTVTGNTIRLTADVFNYSFNQQTLDLSITLAGNRSFNTVSGDIEIKGVLSDDAATASGITKRGNGKLILSATNTYTGQTDVEEGTLILEDGGNISKNSLINVAAGATLEIKAGSHLLGTIAGPGTTVVDAGATLTADSITQDTLTIGSTHAAAVPEPSTLLLLLSAVTGLLLAGRKLRGR